jgi:NADH-quinone oxidoreductase subunit B
MAIDRYGGIPGVAITSKLELALSWGRKYSLFLYPFVTACCGMEYMSVACAHYDIDRFGAGLPRFSPRHSDLLLVCGTVSHKIGPVLHRVWEQMADYNDYATMQGIDVCIPVDVYIPGCPPRPEMVLDGLMKLQMKIQSRKQ